MNRIKLALAMVLALAGMISCLEIAQAQLSPTLQIASEPGNPPVDSRPDDREPAGTRGPCERTDIPFTPLLPVSKTGTRFSVYTLTGHPTFWFYVPYKTSNVKSGKFSLEDEQEQSVYQTDLKLPETPGFVSISIPTKEKPLNKNKPYKWIFTLFCASSNSNSEEATFVFHEGLVQRIDLANLETRLKSATLGERINLYAKNNLWYDAATDFAQTANRPQAWLNLLKVMGLEQLAQTPLTGSVVPVER